MRLAPGCRACLLGAGKSVPQSVRCYSWLRRAAPTQTEERPVASTSRLPGRGPGWTPGSPPALVSPTAGVPIPPVPSPSPARRDQTTKSVKTEMVRCLSTRQPRRALRCFREALKNPLRNFNSDSLNGLLWLFFHYDQRRLALEATQRMHEVGYQISTSVALMLLRGAYHEIVRQPKSLALVLSWLEEGIMHEGMDEGTAESVLELLARLGRSDWVNSVFDTYCRGLAPGELAGHRLWSIVIKAAGQDGDRFAAKTWFNCWRTDWRSKDPNRPPPCDPYIALLTQTAKVVPSGSHIPYEIVEMIQKDGVPLSTPLFNAFLRLELSHRQYGSFWGLWDRMERDHWRKDRSSWTLAIKAKTWQQGTTRYRKPVTQGWMQRCISYQIAPEPSGRALFAAYLLRNQIDTNHRPSLRLPMARIPIACTSVLNRFLKLFVLDGDWASTAIVLETFSVFALEPDDNTHAAVVKNVMVMWERRMIEREEALDDYLEVPDLRAPRTMTEGLEILQKILEGRKLRASLWTAPNNLSPRIYSRDPNDPDDVPPLPVHFAPPVINEGEEEDPEESSPIVFSLPPGVPDWMRQQELRSVSYLMTLLRRCAGMDEDEWARELVATRRKILPLKKRDVQRYQTRREQEEP